jgi:signal transduction histidine kinase
MAPRPAEEGSRAQLATEVQRLEKALEEEKRRNSEFLAQLAHELRNPLAPILTGLEAMGIVGLKDPMLESIREAMRRQTGHLIRLVDDLLDVSRVNHGRMALDRQRIDLATIVSRALESTRDFISEQRHDLAVNLPSDALPVDADPGRLEQVLVILLDNAARYSPPGSGIWLAARRNDNEVVISVRDDGQGITADALPRVFEPFFRGEGAKQAGGNGLGIGLSVVRSLVELHGGRVEALSDGPGNGSEFVVTLPLAMEVSGE